MKKFGEFIKENFGGAHQFGDTMVYVVMWNDNAAPGIPASDPGGIQLYSQESFITQIDTFFDYDVEIEEIDDILENGRLDDHEHLSGNVSWIELKELR